MHPKTLTIFCKICEYKNRNMSVIESIRKTISKSIDGTLFFNNSFPEYDEEYVRHVLSDLCAQGTLERIAFGIYLKPTRSRFGVVYPPVSDIVKAIAVRDKAKILPTGNTAMNQLGLSEQVPMNLEYITSGSAREIKLGKRTIKLRRSVPKNFEYKGELIPVLVLAMKAIGKENLTNEHLGIIRKLIEENPEEKTWQSDLQLAPAWIRKTLSNLRKEITA